MTSCDVLVLGAGSAGSVVAARLSEDPSCQICLVEAGEWPSDPDIADPLRWPYLEGKPFDWAYRTTPQAGTAGRVHPWPRGRAVGGSSCIHALAHVPGHVEDYEAWAEVGGSRWGPAALTAGLARCALPMVQPVPDIGVVTRAYIEAGRAIGAPALARHDVGQLAGATVNTLTVHEGRRVTVADAYLRPALARPNLRVVTGTSAEQLIWDGNRARGVRVRDAGGVRTLEADIVVVCLGAIASPLLLLRSGIGNPAELAEAGVACAVELPEVGRNLHDHLFAAGNVYAARQTVPGSRLQHSESLMYLHGDDPGRPDGAPDCVLACVLLPVVTECFVRPPPGAAYTILFGVTHPTSRGSVTLTGPHAADPPRIDPNYLATEADRRCFRAALRLARAVGHATPLNSWREREVFPGPYIQDETDVDAFVARAAMTHHHPVGTCALGSVVDADLRVLGTENLFVVDASIIPAITTGPVHASVLAIAEIWAADVGTKSTIRGERVAWTD